MRRYYRRARLGLEWRGRGGAAAGSFRGTRGPVGTVEGRPSPLRPPSRTPPRFPPPRWSRAYIGAPRPHRTPEERVLQLDGHLMSQGRRRTPLQRSHIVNRMCMKSPSRTGGDRSLGRIRLLVGQRSRTPAGTSGRSRRGHRPRLGAQKRRRRRDMARRGLALAFPVEGCLPGQWNDNPPPAIPHMPPVHPSCHGQTRHPPIAMGPATRASKRRGSNDSSRRTNQVCRIVQRPYMWPLLAAPEIAAVCRVEAAASRPIALRVQSLGWQNQELLVLRHRCRSRSQGR